jgi:hypothetical protein
MSSVSRSYVQRNNNITQIIPELVYIVPDGDGPNGLDLSGARIYLLNLPNVPVTGGVFYVDLSGNDLSGNPIDGAGRITTGSDSAGIVIFAVNKPTNPVYYPGLEYTIFFRNLPINIPDYEDLPLFTIGMIAYEIQLVPVPYPVPFILSPLIPYTVTAPTNSQSVTYKCDGANFNVTGSGPAGWLGVGAFLYLLSALP